MRRPNIVYRRTENTFRIILNINYKYLTRKSFSFVGNFLFSFFSSSVLRCFRFKWILLDGGDDDDCASMVFTQFLWSISNSLHAPFYSVCTDSARQCCPSTQTFGNDKRCTAAFPLFRFVSFVSCSFDAPFCSRHCVYQLTGSLVIIRPTPKIHPSNVDDVGEGISLLIHFSTMDALHAASSHHSPAQRRLQLDNNIMRFTGECKIRTFHDGLLFHATPTSGHWRVFIVHLWCAFTPHRTHTHTQPD